MSGDKSRDFSLSEKRVSQWEAIMRKFSEAHKEKCKAVSLDIPRVQRSVKYFPTGSQYKGTWDLLGMSGFGTYTFPNGVIYEGEFEDGMFHGHGELRYPSGEMLKGKFKKGQIIERTLVFADGLEYADEDWGYCHMPDRRFTIEYENGLQPAGRSYLTAEQPPKEIPPGYYDTGDGFYDPKTRVVYKYECLNTIVRSPSDPEQKWIEMNCRSSPDVPLGPRPDLYEEWLEPMVERPPSPTHQEVNKACNLEIPASWTDSQEIEASTFSFIWARRASSDMLTWNSRLTRSASDSILDLEMMKSIS